MSKYEHIVRQIAEENPSFEAFYAEMCTHIPALKGRAPIEIPPAGFKRALKAAYLAGDQDAIIRLVDQPPTPPGSSDSQP